MVKLEVKNDDGFIEITNTENGATVDSFTSAFVYEDNTYLRYIVAQGSSIVAKLSFEETIYVPYVEPPPAP